MIQNMPHISRSNLKKETEQKLIHSLYLVLSKIQDYDAMESFLFALLSKTEQLMLAKRLTIIILLKEGISETRISTTLHVTRETVSRIKLLYETRGQGYEIALKKLEEEKVFAEFKNILISLARYSIRAAGGRVTPTILDQTHL